MSRHFNPLVHLRQAGEMFEDTLYHLSFSHLERTLLSMIIKTQMFFTTTLARGLT